MSERRYIYWRKDMPKKDGLTFANVHLLIGYNQGTIADFQQMADKLRETFPQAGNDKIGAGRVHKSSFVNGFSIVTWGNYIPEGDYPDWQQVEDRQMEYFW